MAYHFNVIIKHLPIIVASGLLFISAPVAGALKFYHCQSLDGTVVIQDRHCDVTRLKAVKPDSKPKNKSEALPKSGPRHHSKKLPQARLVPAKMISPQKFVEVIKSHNWFSQLSHNNHGWHLVVDIPSQVIASNSNVKPRISVKYFRDTSATLNTDAFSYALNLYHEIRHQYQLTDSRFKPHPAYKVFNVVYQKASLPAYTEFYMGKLDGSLWVFTLEGIVQTNRLPQRILMQLQALI